MSTISGKTIWEKLKQLPNYRGVSDKVLEIERAFVELLPDILADLLDQQVDYRTLMEAKLAYHYYLLANDYCLAVSTALCKSKLEDELIRTTAEIATELLKQQMAELEMEIFSSKTHFLQNPGAELLYMTTQIRFQPDVLKMYLQDDLTIGQLLELQPVAITDLSTVGKLLP